MPAMILQEGITSCGFERHQSPLIVPFSTVSSKEADGERVTIV